MAAAISRLGGSSGAIFPAAIQCPAAGARSVEQVLADSPVALKEYWLEVHYENLIVNPDTELSRIFDLLGTSKLDGNAISTDLGLHNKNKWRQELSPGDARELQQCCLLATRRHPDAPQATARRASERRGSGPVGYRSRRAWSKGPSFSPRGRALTSRAQLTFECITANATSLSQQVRWDVNARARGLLRPTRCQWIVSRLTIRLVSMVPAMRTSLLVRVS